MVPPVSSKTIHLPRHGERLKLSRTSSFASTPSSRDFWLGKKPGFDRAYIETTYRSLKPCLHGSDAHREATVTAPDSDRYCWIKGDLTFEALRQAVIEPEERVWIGSGYARQSRRRHRCAGTLNGNAMAEKRSHRAQRWHGRRHWSAGFRKNSSGRYDCIRGKRDGFRSGRIVFSEARVVAGRLSGERPGRACSGRRFHERNSVESTSATRAGGPKSARTCYLSQHFVERFCSSVRTSYSASLRNGARSVRGNKILRNGWRQTRSKSLQTPR